MKKNNEIIQILFLLFLFLTYVQGQEKHNPYKFPLKPGDEGWKSLTTHVEKVNVLQIPDSILTGIITGDLVLTCLSYPLFSDMFAFNSYQYGFEMIRKNFNGFKELFIRKDAFYELIKTYNAMDPSSFKKNWATVERGYFAAEYLKITIILAQEDILKNLSRENLLILLNSVYEKNIIMISYPRVFNRPNILFNMLLMGRILSQDQDPEFLIKINSNTKLKIFLNTINEWDNGNYNEILLSAKNRIKN
jgi:hypothetical protein